MKILFFINFFYFHINYLYLNKKATEIKVFCFVQRLCWRRKTLKKKPRMISALNYLSCKFLLWTLTLALSIILFIAMRELWFY